MTIRLLQHICNTWRLQSTWQLLDYTTTTADDAVQYCILIRGLHRFDLIQ